MSLVNIYVIEGVFSESEKTKMIQKVTDAVIEVSGELTRGITWVKVHDIPDGQWGIAGNIITASDMKQLRDNEY
ncbi:tautomerase family protein [Lentilitoribacter sp. EG35]|uniref:tautomerase family protein n=1 Tax=Lentilitoribacter sp. EG35 TaxID=3234192 RepID=UPI00345F87B8